MSQPIIPHTEARIAIRGVPLNFAQAMAVRVTMSDTKTNQEAARLGPAGKARRVARTHVLELIFDSADGAGAISGKTPLGAPGPDDGQIIIGSTTLSTPERRVLDEALEAFIRSLNYLESCAPGLGPIGPLYYDSVCQVRKIIIFGAP